MMNQKNFDQALRKHHKLCENVRHLTRPLIEAFDLAQFCYFFVDSSGHSSALSTHPSWMDYYMNQELFIHNPFLRSPHNISEGVYLAKGVKDPDYQKSFKKAEIFGIQDSLVIIEKAKGKLIGFSFGLKSDIYQQQLFNEVPLLKNYCRFFQKEAYKVIDNLDRVDTRSFIGDSFTKSQEDLDPFKQKKGNLLSLMGVHEPRLSPREKECLVHYLSGETANSIARILGLSTRTVESYLENIKIKLCCFQKTELIKKAKQLFDCGLLIP